MITRAKARGSSAISGISRVQVNGAPRRENVQPATSNFEAASAAERKRKAEEGTNDQVSALTQTIKQLMNAQKEVKESQQILMETAKHWRRRSGL